MICELCSVIRKSTVYGQQSTEESRRDDITQAGVSTPANSKQTPKPRRGNKENSKEINSVRSVSSVRENNSEKKQTLETAILRIEQRGIDVTARYHDWYRIGMALASHYGEAGRDYYHRISRYYPRYTADETNKQYDRCLRYNTHRIHLGTLFYLIQSTDNR